MYKGDVATPERLRGHRDAAVNCPCVPCRVPWVFQGDGAGGYDPSCGEEEVLAVGSHRNPVPSETSDPASTAGHFGSCSSCTPCPGASWSRRRVVSGDRDDRTDCGGALNGVLAAPDLLTTEWAAVLVSGPLQWQVYPVALPYAQVCPSKGLCGQGKVSCKINHNTAAL